MKTYHIALIVSLFTCGTSYAQNSPLNQSVVGHNAADAFTYNGNTVSHYSVGWYNDMPNTPPMAYLSGYNGFKFFTGQQPRLIIDVDGRIGIGTVSPVRDFQLGNSGSNYGGYGRLQGNFLSLGGQNHARWEFNDQNFGIGAGKMSNNGTTDDDLYLWSYKGEGRDIRFMSTFDGNSDVATWSSNMIIKGESGNVGIGTTDPKGYKLAVAGNIISENITVKLQSQWPDYVFKPSYKLPSIKTVKAYIDRNRHLPDMPSDSDVAKEGVNLGEMNRLLLKKIEELTLYLIAKDTQLNLQQKQLNQQAIQIKQLKKRIK